MAICPNCGEQVSDEAGFCGSCGGQMAAQYHPPPPMMPVRPPKKDYTMIAVVLVIVIVVVVVIAATLLFFFRPHTVNGYEAPLGLVQQSRTSSSVTILVASAPNGALVDGSEIYLMNDDWPVSIEGASIYWPNGLIAADYNSLSGIVGWAYHNGANRNTLEFQAGMTILIINYGISNGDELTFYSMEEYFGTTTITIN
jgi:hypothetical protein